MNARVHVTLYTRPGCHLCERAKEEMQRAGCPELYTLDEIDIESDPALIERYGTEIPVVLINGIKAFKYHLSAKEFRRKLNRAGRL